MKEYDLLYGCESIPMTYIYRGTWCDKPKVWAMPSECFYEITYIYEDRTGFPTRDDWDWN